MMRGSTTTHLQGGLKGFARLRGGNATGEPAGRVRLLPIAIAGMIGLVSLKLLGLTLNGSYTVSPQLPGVPELADQQLSKDISRVVAVRRGPGGIADDALLTGATGKSEPKPDPKEAAKAKPEGSGEDPLAKKFNPPANDPRGAEGAQPVLSEAEMKLLERLKQRRADIENRNSELDTRENLLKASEMKLDQRITELRELEAKLDTGQSAKKEKQQADFKALVTMYEGMKPKDAARVFDKLDTTILMDLVPQMNPRKTSEIIAAMSTEGAQRLTMALAAKAKGEAVVAVAPAQPDLPPSELPRIDTPRR